jgi:regulator of replication initiation timing
MTQFNAFHIKQFNQKCKHLIGAGKVVFEYKELRDLQAELLDLMIHVANLESENAKLKEQLAKAGDITVELVGKPFR